MRLLALALGFLTGFGLCVWRLAQIGAALDERDPFEPPGHSQAEVWAPRRNGR